MYILRLTTDRLLQLVMGCAVNCDNKSVYIEAIMSMDEEDQRLIMQSIQELMDLQTAQAEPRGAIQ